MLVVARRGVWKEPTEIYSIGFPQVGSLHPLGTTIDFVSIQMEIDRSINAHFSSSLCTMLSSDRSKPITMTAVITGINEDGSLSTTIKNMEGVRITVIYRDGRWLMETWGGG